MNNFDVSLDCNIYVNYIIVCVCIAELSHSFTKQAKLAIPKCIMYNIEKNIYVKMDIRTIFLFVFYLIKGKIKARSLNRKNYVFFLDQACAVNDVIGTCRIGLFFLST